MTALLYFQKSVLLQPLQEDLPFHAAENLFSLLTLSSPDTKWSKNKHVLAHQAKPSTVPSQMLVNGRDCKNELCKNELCGSFCLVLATESWEGKRGWQTSSHRTQIFLEANTLLRSWSLWKWALPVFVTRTSHKQPAVDKVFFGGGFKV